MATLAVDDYFRSILLLVTIAVTIAMAAEIAKQATKTKTVAPAELLIIKAHT